MVRAGENIKSRELPRLSCGAIIEEEEPVKGDRLHFSKISGDGPDFGWVSLMFKTTALVKKISK